MGLACFKMENLQFRRCPLFASCFLALFSFLLVLFIVFLVNLGNQYYLTYQLLLPILPIRLSFVLVFLQLGLNLGLFLCMIRECLCCLGMEIMIQDYLVFKVNSHSHFWIKLQLMYLEYSTTNYHS